MNNLVLNSSKYWKGKIKYDKELKRKSYVKHFNCLDNKKNSE